MVFCLLDVGSVGQELRGDAGAEGGVDALVHEAVAGNGAGGAAEQHGEGVLGLADVLTDIGKGHFGGIEVGLALHHGGAGEDVGFLEGFGGDDVFLAIFDRLEGDLQLLIQRHQLEIIERYAGHELGLHVAAESVALQ